MAVLLLLAVAATTCGRRHHIKKGGGLLGGESEDDIRDNVINYDEQGGGEEDEVRLLEILFIYLVCFYASWLIIDVHVVNLFLLQNAFNIDMLWTPHDAPSTPGSYCPVPRVPRGKQPLRMDAPHNLPSPIYPRRPPADPTDIEDYINDVRHIQAQIIV